MAGDFNDEELDFYLEEASRYPLLTRQQEQDLVRAMIDGSNVAKRELINSNLRLVVDIAGDYLDRGLSYLDLIEEGNLGLMTAVDHSAVEGYLAKGTRFSTYASYWIRGAIQRALNTASRTIRLPEHIEVKLRHWHTTADKLRQRLGREPSKDEITAKLDLPFSARERLKRTVGMLERQEQGEVVEWEDISGDTIEILNSFSEDEINEIFDNVLDDREQEILRRRFGFSGEPQTLREIGSELGISMQRVKQVEKKALMKLRNYLQRIH